MKKYNHWGQYVQEMRIEKNYTLREFCRETEIDPSNWSKVERGIADPPKDSELLQRILKLLELNEGVEQIRFWMLFANSNVPRKTMSVYDNLPILLSGKSEAQLMKLFELIKNS